MKDDQFVGFDPERRMALRALALVPVAGLLGWRPVDGAAVRAATPACGETTEPQGAGPFFKPRSPERTSLMEPGLKGTPVAIGGRVLTTACVPVALALLDFWQADEDGDYDTAGFRLRGHQFTDAAGRFHLETILPAAYSGRTRHIHVNVQAPGGRILTTQLYFPGEPTNARDGQFSPRLLLDMRAAGRGTFDFVLGG
jgi:protocatechuate 3,4-dioxygenase beta subunit